MTEEQAFLAAIAAEPEDDVSKLVYADWLDEHDDPRGEFIRLQYELEKYPPYRELRTDCPPVDGNSGIYKHCYNLRVREYVFLAAYQDKWRRGPVCETCGQAKASGGSFNSTWNVCPQCHGTGDAGGLMRKFTTGRIEDGTSETELVHIEWDRGFPGRVVVPQVGDLVRDACSKCGGYGGAHTHAACDGDLVWQPTPWLRAVVQHHPVSGCVPLDREPYHYRAPAFPPDHVLHGMFRWGRRSSWGEDNTDLLPDLIFDALRDMHFGEASRSCRYFPTRELALSALGRAFVQLAKKATPEGSAV
jgi:uncharacterized protein (TIGR02996 family)